MSTKLQKTTLIGSILTAGLASVCCIGPVVFALLGIGGAGAMMQFEEYRPLFIAVALLLLTLGFYLTYIKPAPETCEPDSLCAKPGSSLANKSVLWGATLLVGFFIFFPSIFSKLF